jgi:protein TonB
LLVQKVEPLYQRAAKDAYIQGVGQFTITVGGDGQVNNAKLVSGHRLLVEAAREAVLQ